MQKRNKQKTWRYKLYFISSEFFQYSLLTYLLLFIVETLQKGFVSNFFNLNVLLPLVLINGMIMVFSYTDTIYSHEKVSGEDAQMIIAFIIGAGCFVYFRTQAMDTLAYVFACLAVVVIGISFVVFLLKKDE